MEQQIAEKDAQWCANKYNTIYMTIKCRNGQFMRERKEFIDSGKASYTTKELATAKYFYPQIKK
jgi:hypothetical protein